MKKKILLIAAIVVVIVVGGIVGMKAIGSMGEEKYWQEPADIEAVMTYREDEYESDLDEYELMKEEYVELDDLAEEWMEKAVPIEGMYLEALQSCNEYIIEYFLKNYNFDVTEKINNLEIYQTDIPDEYLIAGFYWSLNDAKQVDFELNKGKDRNEFNKFYINTTEMVNEEYDDLIFIEVSDSSGTYTDVNEMIKVYIHETLHYLAFTADGIWNMLGLVEGFTTYITADIVAYMTKEEIITLSGRGYDTACLVAETMATYDKNIVLEFLKNDGEIDLEGYVNSVFDAEYADEFSCYLDILTIVPGSSSDDAEDYLFMVQYFTNEYVKAVSDNYEDASSNIYEDFGLKWMLH